MVDVDPATGRATAIRRIAVDQPAAQRLAALAKKEREAEGRAGGS